MNKLTLLITMAFALYGCFGSAEDGFIDGGSNGSGVGGSTARFAINGDYLYIVDHTSLKVVDIETEKDPTLKSTVEMGNGIETIYGYKDNLFIGSQTGMHIYRVSDEGRPQYLSQFIHQRTCDPVIANDQFAYITIRSGENCGTGLFEANQLITLDISDLQNPRETSQQQMINPRGLTFFKGDLYVAEGSHGLKKFSLNNPAQPVMVEFFEDIPANDMISLPTTMIITRDEGIYQFGCEDGELYFLSPIL
ncbi:MAG: hypothetical protein RJQ14_26150 [Marinoscillum sp.]